MFYTLAQAVCSCMTAVKMWKEELLVPVLDQLFRTPSPWKRENVAGFLLFCSEKVRKDKAQPHFRDLKKKAYVPLSSSWNTCNASWTALPRDSRSAT